MTRFEIIQSKDEQEYRLVHEGLPWGSKWKRAVQDKGYLTVLPHKRRGRRFLLLTVQCKCSWGKSATGCMEGNLILCSRKLHTTDLRLKQDMLLVMGVPGSHNLLAGSKSCSLLGRSTLMQIHQVDCNSLKCPYMSLIPQNNLVDGEIVSAKQFQQWTNRDLVLSRVQTVVLQS